MIIKKWIFNVKFGQLNPNVTRSINYTYHFSFVLLNLLYSFSLGSDNAYMYYKNRLLKDKKIVATNNVVESRVETPNVIYGQSLQCTLSPEEVEVIKKYRDQKQSAQEAALEKDAEALANFTTYRSNVSNPNASFERPGYSYVKSRKQ